MTIQFLPATNAGSFSCRELARSVGRLREEPLIWICRYLSPKDSCPFIFSSRSMSRLATMITTTLRSEFHSRFDAVFQKATWDRNPYNSIVLRLNWRNEKEMLDSVAIELSHVALMHALTDFPLAIFAANKIPIEDIRLKMILGSSDLDLFNKCLERGNLVGAEEIAKSMPDNDYKWLAILILSNAYLEQGDWTRVNAIVQLSNPYFAQVDLGRVKRIVDLMPDNNVKWLATLTLSNAYLAQRDVISAEEIVDLMPDHGLRDQVLWNISYFYLGQGNLIRARESADLILDNLKKLDLLLCIIDKYCYPEFGQEINLDLAKEIADSILDPVKKSRALLRVFCVCGEENDFDRAKAVFVGLRWREQRQARYFWQKWNVQTTLDSV